MTIDRVMAIEYRPPLIRDVAEIGDAMSAISISRETRLPQPLPNLKHLREVWLLGLAAPQLVAILEQVDAEILHIEGTHAPDLGILERLQALRRLAIDWNTKVERLEFLERLPRLEVLSLTDLKRVHDLGPLSSLKALRALQLAGGIWSMMVVESLAPLADLEALEELRFASIRIRDGSLDPLARLTRLKRLTIPSNAASTEQFAHLAARLPRVACAELHPYVRFDGVIMPHDADPVAALSELGDDTVLVTGKGKPFLRAKSDRKRLLRYCMEFEAMRRNAL